jgi:predicted unusual protein kinase regulating ubiquinone biosynthesis (AarF/ABC1/UbiB family)
VRPADARERDDERIGALAEELVAQLRRLKGGGPMIGRFLSMLELERAAASEPQLATLGRIDHGALPFGHVRRVIEKDLEERVGKLFADIEDEPFALSSLGQVHRARTNDGEVVAVKVQRRGVAEAVEGDLRNLGLVAPILGRLAPGLDASAVLAEMRERIADELDYEIEAQHQRRLARRFRGHPHVRVPGVRTDLSTRRVLVTEYVDGLHADGIRRLGDAERDRIGEIVFRFFFGLVWRDGTVAGDPHPDDCILCPDGRLCVVGFGLVRDVDRGYLERERRVMRAIAEEDAPTVHDRLSHLGYLPEPASFDRHELLEHLATAGEWLLARGFRRIDRAYVDHLRELGYPPRSPYFPLLRRMSLPPETLLLRRMEARVLDALGDFQAGADWGAIAAEHHSDERASTPLGQEDRAFFERRAT